MKHAFHLSKNNDEYHFSIHRCNRLGENDQWYSFIFDSEDMETLRTTVSLESKTSARHELLLKRLAELEKLEATVISLAIGVDKLETDAVSQRTVNSVLQKAVVDDRKRVEVLENENKDALKAHATRGLLLTTMLQRLEKLESDNRYFVGDLNHDTFKRIGELEAGLTGHAGKHMSDNLVEKVKNLERFKEDHIKYDASDRADLQKQCSELRFRVGALTMALNDNHEEIHKIKDFLEMKG
jgi:hypothetical protein